MGLTVGLLCGITLTFMVTYQRPSTTDTDVAWLSHFYLDGSDETGIGLKIRASNVPTITWGVRRRKLKIEAEAKTTSGSILSVEEAYVNQFLFLPIQNAGRFHVRDIVVHFKLISVRGSRSREIGHCFVSLQDLVQDHGKDYKEKLLVCDSSESPVLMSRQPYYPCELSVAIAPKLLPGKWRTQAAVVGVQAGQDEGGSYPRHIFLMTRGTRGDVQPFVALARGLAEQRGWLVTICTEYRWKQFVKENSNVSRGRILFRSAGGDTELRTSGALERWAMKQKTELMQMMMLAMSEKEFLPSAPVIVYQIMETEKATQQVDLLVFAFTLSSVAALAGEYLQRPIVGSIRSHSLPLIDQIEDMLCDHKTLSVTKEFIEKNPFSAWNLDELRGWFGLPPANTYDLFRRERVPLVIPMRSDTFRRPHDWWDEITTTDFIFLRRGDAGTKPKSDSAAAHARGQALLTCQVPTSTKANVAAAGSLGEPLESFIASARAQRGKLCLMTVSSMPIDKQIVLNCAEKMVAADPNLRLIYIGKQDGKPFPSSLRDQCIEVERADFGLLFPRMDAFIVHGGLGTTVEALRTQKPVCVTGPLLLDQRFWGDVCAKKGVGPEPVHIDQFEDSCADFIRGALGPSDPNGWQRNALQHNWGDVADDGVRANVARIAELLEEPGRLRPLRSPASRWSLWILWLKSYAKWYILFAKLIIFVCSIVLVIVLFIKYFVKPCFGVLQQPGAGAEECILW
eukprot:TRINITY_DN45533_c0_g1_i1.p1 TRINITY_DN45533_c0_g1~~TRINITY_DN45533_c0_g1_i1.p1  ORF type:complete len:804 (-),score=160.15 TRINITY_DN45533_c0_g1_i1:278-2491(-)